MANCYVYYPLLNLWDMYIQKGIKKYLSCIKGKGGKKANC